jgi:peroxiredoxin
MKRTTLRLLLSLLTPLTLRAQLTVGADAPPIDLDHWLNVDGPPPTLKSLQGKVILLEFWGTWCAPCVRAMPEVQRLHERYGERGLAVLAISYEAPAVQRPFLEKNAYTMAAGADPARKVVNAYKVSSWPKTVIIDSAGKIAHVGSPYDAEAAVERALGLTADAGVLLVDYLHALGNPNQLRSALERLVEKAPATFDLRAWAQAQLEGTGQNPARPDAPAHDPKDATAGKKHDDVALLRACAAAWNKDKAMRDAALLELRAASAAFDLATFAREALANAFPGEAAQFVASQRKRMFDELAGRYGKPEPRGK